MLFSTNIVSFSPVSSARPKDTGFIASASDLVVRIPIAVWRDMAI